MSLLCPLENLADKPVEQAGAVPAGPIAPRIANSTLGPAAAAEVEALRNDFEQAKEIAAEYQNSIAGKSNELAQLKLLFAQTRQHLIQLQKCVTQLRDERHHLANEAMRAVALEGKLAKVIAERDRFKAAIQLRQGWQG